MSFRTVSLPRPTARASGLHEGASQFRCLSTGSPLRTEERAEEKRITWNLLGAGRRGGAGGMRMRASGYGGVNSQIDRLESVGIDLQGHLCASRCLPRKQRSRRSDPGTLKFPRGPPTAARVGYALDGWVGSRSLGDDAPSAASHLRPRFVGSP